MGIEILLDKPNDVIVKVSLGNLNPHFLRFHSFDGEFYIKDIGSNILHKLKLKESEVI